MVDIEGLVDVGVWTEFESVQGLELDHIGEKVGPREYQVCSEISNHSNIKPRFTHSR